MFQNVRVITFTISESLRVSQQGGGGLPLRPTHIRIKMIKICDKSLLQPLILLFHNSVKSSCYPDIWKRFNIITVHKKSDKQLVGNYRLISILPMFVKIF